MTEVVYRSTHRDVLAHWDTVAAGRAEWPQVMKAALARWDLPEAKVVNMTHYGVPFSVEYPQGPEIPHGWRRDRRGDLTPRKSTTRGKEIAAEMETLACPKHFAGLPGGMPSASIVIPHLLSPTITRHGDTVYAAWSREPDAGDMQHVDETAWQQVKLSEYHVALEAEEAEL